MGIVDLHSLLDNYDLSVISMESIYGKHTIKGVHQSITRNRRASTAGSWAKLVKTPANPKIQQNIPAAKG